MKNYYDYKRLKEVEVDIKKIFFYRVCGTGMGSAAALLKQSNFDVSGCDKLFYPPMSDYLINQDINLIDQSKVDIKFLQNFDLIIVGNVVCNGSKEALMLEGSGVPCTSFPTALGVFVLDKKEVIGIAGTHGKTTTSYLLVQILQNIGIQTGYLIGGVLNNESSAAIGKSDLFVIEADEYDSAYFEKYSKFLSYNLRHIILTSLEFDHADIFNSIDSIKDEFKKLNQQKTFLRDSCNIVCSDYCASENLFKDNIFYGVKQSSPSDIVVQNNQTSFSIRYRDQKLEFETNIVGKHNIYNLTSCILFCLYKQINPTKIQDAILDLKFVKRRQEVRGSYRGAIIVDDFAHHPTAVKSTIEVIKAKYPSSDLNIIIEANSATSRSSIFQKEFAESFNGAKHVFICKPSRKSNIKNYTSLDVCLLSRELNQQNIIATTSGQLEDLRDFLDLYSEPNSVMLIMSNSTCLGLWESSFINEIY